MSNEEFDPEEMGTPDLEGLPEDDSPEPDVEDEELYAPEEEVG